MSEVVKVGADTFQKWVLESDRPVLVDFYADWCPPCRQLKPLLEELAVEYKDSVRIVKVNSDESPELAQKFGITGLPTVVCFKGGKASQSLVGLQPKPVYKKVISSLTGAST
jgi:thioredoxin 1